MIVLVTCCLQEAQTDVWAFCLNCRYIFGCKERYDNDTASAVESLGAQLQMFKVNYVCVKASAASRFRLLPELFDVYAGGDGPTMHYSSSVPDSMYSARELYYAATVRGPGRGKGSRMYERAEGSLLGEKGGWRGEGGGKGGWRGERGDGGGRGPGGGAGAKEVLCVLAGG